MKKTLRYLFLVALLFTVAGAFAVSCQKGGEEDVPQVGSQRKPTINPKINPDRDVYYINTDGTTLSGSSTGYNFEVRAKAITFNDFKCYLDDSQEFLLFNECNLTLIKNSVISMSSTSVFLLTGGPLRLSGNGSLTLKQVGKLNETGFKEIYAADGFTMTYSGAVDKGDNIFTYTWTVKKSK